MDLSRFRLTCVLGVVLTTIAQAATVTNVNRAGPECLSGAGGSYLPTFSEEGGWIAFVSHANNLVTNDDSGLALDVFVAGLFGQSTELISVNRAGVGGGNADSTHPLVSRYGTMVVFASRGSNLTTNDTNNAVDMFLRHRASVAETRLITTDRSGRGLVDPRPYSASPLSTQPALGPDVFPEVVFQSSGTNLVNAPIVDTNNASDIFLYEPNARTNRLVSVARTDDSTGNGASHSPRFNRPYIGFISTATNLHDFLSTTNSNRDGDIYVVDSTSGVMHWASPNARNLLVGAFPAPPSAYSCFNVAISANGAVAYQANPGPSYPTIPGYPTVLLYCPFGASTAVRISADTDPASPPHISDDGTLVAYTSRSNVYVWNSLTQSNTLISANTNGLPGNGISHSPVMNRFGAYVVFVSRATDLVTNTPSGSFQIYMRTLPDGGTRLVSVNTNGNASMGNFEHSNIALAREGGALVAFDSTAPDLVAGDLNGQSDVFVRDLPGDETRLISRRHGALPARTMSPISGTALPASISGDGRFIAFTSMDNPGIPNDTNIWQDLYVRDTASGRLQLVTSGSLGLGSQGVVEPVAVSRSGTHVSFIVRGGPTGPGTPGLFWRDLSAETNVLVGFGLFGLEIGKFALSSNGTLLVFQDNQQIRSRQMPDGPTNRISVSYSGSPANNTSSNAVLSPNDRWVVFQSAATDIVYFEPAGGSYSPPPGTLYARDLLSNTSKVASITASNIVAVRGPAVFSANSEWIGYVVTNREIYVRQLTNNFRANVCASCDQPSLSGDASFVAYQTVPTNGPSQIYVKNMRNGVVKLISASALGTEANGPAAAPQITADGRFIVFQSTASNLVENDNNNASDIFLGDRVLGKVLLLSINQTGNGSGNGPSSKAVLSADGRTVVFQSLANDLIAGDYNDRRDVFVATLSLPDSDGDGMDDDFEVTYFGNLERNGAGDMDNDGHTDWEEFLAGTNPVDNTSILRVVSISAPGATARQLVWSSTPGRTYRVQFKDALADDWSTLAGSVRANASTTAATDDSNNPQRFYRVVLEQ